MDRQKDRQIRKTDFQTEIQIYRQTDRHTHRQIDRQIDTNTDRQIDRYSQTDIQIANRQKVKQTDIRYAYN